jgi:hypothetical protein
MQLKKTHLAPTHPYLMRAIVPGSAGVDECLMTAFTFRVGRSGAARGRRPAVRSARDARGLEEVLFQREKSPDRRGNISEMSSKQGNCGSEGSARGVVLRSRGAVRRGGHA